MKRKEAMHAADDARRHDIPVGGNFKPAPKVPVIVTITHGMRIVLSRDDGKTWKQVFMGASAGDHGYRASTNIAYTNGVFAGFSGWGSTGHGSFIASDDGVNWRHLAGKNRKGRWDSYSMNDTLGAAGGQGAFVTVGTSFESTPDFGVSWKEVYALSPKDIKTDGGAQGFADKCSHKTTCPMIKSRSSFLNEVTFPDSAKYRLNSSISAA